MKYLAVLFVFLLSLVPARAMAGEPLFVYIIVNYFDCRVKDEWGFCQPIPGADVRAYNSTSVVAASTRYDGMATFQFVPESLPDDIVVNVDGALYKVVQVVEGDWHYHVYFYKEPAATSLPVEPEPTPIPTPEPTTVPIAGLGAPYPDVTVFLPILAAD